MSNFYSPTRGEVGFSQIVDRIREFMEAEPGSNYLVVIGSDSQAKHLKGQAEIDFVTAIIVHRIGLGAIYFLKKERKNRVPALHEKITEETLMSVQTALQLTPLLKDANLPRDFGFEIHIDVGENGPTREFIREAVGMVNGNGFKAKIKPESWGASSVADKHT